MAIMLNHYPQVCVKADIHRFSDTSETQIKHYIKKDMKARVVKVLKKTSQKHTKTLVCKKSETIIVSVPFVNLRIGDTFKSVSEMAKAFGAKVLSRRGFGYIGKTASNADVAVWTVNMVKNPYWNNQLLDNGNTIHERKINGESSAEFLNRVRKDLDYDANQLRLTFAKDKKGLHFIGVFQLSGFDVDNQTAIYKRVGNHSLLVYYKRMTKTQTITIEESVETIEGMVLI